MQVEKFDPPPLKLKSGVFGLETTTTLYLFLIGLDLMLVKSGESLLHMQ